MAYITTGQLSQRVGATLYARLTDRVSGASPDSAVAQQIIDEAEAETNAILAHRYATPIDLAEHPELANTVAARVLDIAEFIAWKASPFVSEVPLRVQRLYSNATAWLNAVARREAVLPADRPPAERIAESDAAQFVAAPRTFTAAELDGL